jgi:hypothetical protein
MYSEPVFLNVYGAPELIPRNNSASLCSLAGRYDDPIPPQFTAPIDFLKFPAQLFEKYSQKRNKREQKRTRKVKLRWGKSGKNTPKKGNKQGISKIRA